MDSCNRERWLCEICKWIIFNFPFFFSGNSRIFLYRRVYDRSHSKDFSIRVRLSSGRLSAQWLEYTRFYHCCNRVRFQDQIFILTLFLYMRAWTKYQDVLFAKCSDFCLCISSKKQFVQHSFFLWINTLFISSVEILIKFLFYFYLCYCWSFLDC